MPAWSFVFPLPFPLFDCVLSSATQGAFGVDLTLPCLLTNSELLPTLCHDWLADCVPHPSSAP